LTGSAIDRLGNEIERTELESLALRSGLVVKDSVTAKGCRLLVAADTSTSSGKANQARRFGIPVASVEDFLNSVGTAQPLPADRLEATGVPLVCVSCGHSWIAERQSREPRRETCSNSRT
jgi:DNA polymerase III subunit epsilon